MAPDKGKINEYQSRLINSSKRDYTNLKEVSHMWGILIEKEDRVGMPIEKEKNTEE